ncbi:PREDICTED: zinc finger MYM-type protein 1-like [Gekko japonicus]|uniref:Zinc finger MYM-type protein 1-like n=1 Tax=Gekko japonicus TaxID=146911 RepID=A0ABM1KA48_GEKJA|nr:PREDICTED: zinc finger MYM-type protein 1-like [Gekko japonicus]
MDRFGIIKKEVLSDAEDSSCTPTTSFRKVKQKPGQQDKDTWKRTYEWLSYNVATEKAYCDICRLAANDMNVPLPNTSRDKDAREIFVQNGFSDWEKAPFKFHSHQNSNLHRAAVQAIASVKEGLNAHSKFSESQQKQMQDARKALLTILSSVRYLVCEGSEICSHDEEESNLKQLLLLRAEDIPQLKSWLNRTNYKWISPTIVNEMLEIMAHNVLRTLAREIRKAVYYSIIIDEITDITTQKQVSFCFRIATEDMFVKEFFFGFYETAETLSSVLNDILCHFDLSLDRCRGQCYDGALHVARHLSEVQALVKAEEPRALYVHCFANVVNLVVQDMSENVTMCRSFLSELSDMITFVKTSPKCLAFSKHFQQAENINLRQFYSTGWTVRAASLEAVASNYGELIQLFENVSSEEGGDPGAKADGYAQSLWSFSSYFMLQLLLLVFGCLDTLNTALQKSNLQFHQAELLFASAKESTKQLQNNFEQFWSRTVTTAKDLDLESPTVPECRKPARCVVAGCDDLHQFQSPKDFYRKIFYETIDNIFSSLDSRFPSDVFQHMSKIEKFAIGEDDSSYILNFYKTDLDTARLRLHRDMLLDIARERKVKLLALCDVIDLFSGEQGKSLHHLLPELAKLIRIGLTIPVSSCTSESSLSCLLRVKTFLQSSMSQAGLNLMAILYGHKEISQEIDLNVVANEFIQRTSIRTSTFSVI